MGGFESHGFASLYEGIFEFEQSDSNAKSGLQFLGMKRLGQVIIGARFQTLNYTLFGVFSREQQDIGIRVGPMRPNLSANVDAVPPRHHPIEQCDARRFRSIELFPSAYTILCRDDFISPFRQEPLKHQARDLFVVGDQDLHFETPWHRSARTGRSRSTAPCSAVRLDFDVSASPFFALCSS